MNPSYIFKLAQTLPFPQDARAAIIHAVNQVQESAAAEFDQAIAVYHQSNYDHKALQPCLQNVSVLSGVHIYTVNLVLLLECCQALQESFQSKGISRHIFLDTIEDFCYKAQECYDIYGVWGNFVIFWYPILFQGKLFKLGRLEYEHTVYSEDTSYEKYGVILKYGTPVLSIHIPSSGPLTEDSCIDSYRRAQSFFHDNLTDGRLVCICQSWLLHSSTKLLLSPASNTVRFMGDFDLIGNHDHDEFSDKWRVFGKDFELPLDQLPEKTSMQREYKRYLQDGGKTGVGLGVLVFDGEHVLTGAPT